MSKEYDNLTGRLDLDDFTLRLSDLFFLIKNEIKGLKDRMEAVESAWLDLGAAQTPAQAPDQVDPQTSAPTPDQVDLYDALLQLARATNTNVYIFRDHRYRNILDLYPVQLTLPFSVRMDTKPK